MLFMIRDIDRESHSFVQYSGRLSFEDSLWKIVDWICGGIYKDDNTSEAAPSNVPQVLRAWRTLYLPIPTPMSFWRWATAKRKNPIGDRFPGGGDIRSGFTFWILPLRFSQGQDAYLEGSRKLKIKPPRREVYIYIQDPITGGFRLVHPSPGIPGKPSNPGTK